MRINWPRMAPILVLATLMVAPAIGEPAEGIQVPVVPEEVPKNRQQQIETAAPEKAQVAPKKPRRVLIWNTPFMDKSPHKRWCIPFGTYAMEVLGAKTGAFEPVVSDDI
ncbi:MAG: hypothetical protein ACE5JM_08310, partial [Armatimonadota bacterium]